MPRKRKPGAKPNAQNQAEVREQRAQEARNRRLSFRPDDIRSTAEILIRWALEGDCDPEDVASCLSKSDELLLWDVVFDMGLPFDKGGDQ